MNFEQALRGAGLIPGHIEADGRLRRCATETKPAKKNGWYVLHADGHGVWGDNMIAPRQMLGSWKDSAAKYTAPSPELQARIQAQRDRDRAYRVQATKNARAFWNASRPLNRPHPYIEGKGLTPQGCAGLRTNDGLLVVPVVNGDWLTSVQTIAADGEKKFWPGATVKGGAFILQRERAAITVIVEGLSTGLAVYQSVRMARVVVTFDSGNLLPVIQRIKPSGSVVIGADNDFKTARLPHMHGVNPGIAAAKNAAELIGCGVTWPEGCEGGRSGADWADALAEWGATGPRKVERAILAGAKYVRVAA